MRALKLLGLTEDGAGLVCQEPETGELFTVPASQRVRAAALTDQHRPEPRIGQRRTETLESPMEPQLRPREIQSRIRSGATLEQVAAEAQCETSRIERFAFPVMMERSMIADRGRQARPLIDGVPAAKTVEKLVRETLAPRGQASSMQWDAYRTEEGSWVLLLTWNAGRSENTARWTYHHSASGGTLTALDDAAGEIIDPAPRPLRTVPEAVVEPPPAPPINPLATQYLPATTPAPEATRSHGSSPLPAPSAPSAPVAPVGRPQPAPRAGTNKVAAALAHHAATPSGQGTETREQVARTGTEDAGHRDQRKPMPSWEDVLLGGR